MNKATLISVVALALACGGGGYYVLKVKPVEDAKSVVRDSLKDPSSAVFRDVTVNAKNGTACGLVNAKNSMGGYVGMRGFLKTKAGSVEFEPSGEAIGDSAAKIAALQERLEFVERLQKECGLKDDS